MNKIKNKFASDNNNSNDNPIQTTNTIDQTLTESVTPFIFSDPNNML